MIKIHSNTHWFDAGKFSVIFLFFSSFVSSVRHKMACDKNSWKRVGFSPQVLVKGRLCTQNIRKTYKGFSSSLPRIPLDLLGAVENSSPESRQVQR